MQRLKSILARIFKKPLSVRKRWTYSGTAKQMTVVIVDNTIKAIVIFAALALILLIWLDIRPVQTASIKVPVATDRANYYPGQAVGGIFFGDTYYRGEVRVLREVFCSHYKGIIKPPASSAIGDLFSTQSRTRHLEGETVPIGNLPTDVPVGANCVLQFSNIYEIQTLFGIRRIEYQYYTQNFSIITKSRSDQLVCEATGRTDCNIINDEPVSTQATSAQPQSTPEIYPAVVQPSTTPPSTQKFTEPTPAPKIEERCAVNILAVKLACKQTAIEKD